MSERWKILFAASEATPLAKTGGLADVAGALPAALAALGHEVSVVMPAYRGIDRGRFRLVSEPIHIEIPLGGETMHAGVLRCDAIPGVTIRLIDQPGLFGRRGLYEEAGTPYPDNGRRFAFFSRAVLELARRDDRPPDIIHCNDWQTALVPVYRSVLHPDDPVLERTRIVFSIHNLAYQGRFPASLLAAVGLPSRLYATEGGLEFYGSVSFLKGGIVFSDLLTTVSPTYAREIQTPEQGAGMDGLLRSRAAVLHGVRNGIDVVEWDPAKDPELPVALTPERPEEKRKVREALLGRCGLPDPPGGPVVGIVSRLAAQKGLDLVASAVEPMLVAGATLVVLGRGEPRFEALFEGLMRAHPDRVHVRLAFDNPLAHRIYGGADLFLMPSRYEPCGLGQMIAMRYGTVPVARRTGGLADTIADVDGRRNGFLFDAFRVKAFIGAFRRAVEAWSDGGRWRRIVRRCMEGDYSWAAAAREYHELYGRARSGRPGREGTR